MSKKSRDLRIWLFQYQKARERDHNFYIRVSESLLPKIPLIKVGNRNLAKIKDTKSQPIFNKSVETERLFSVTRIMKCKYGELRSFDNCLVTFLIPVILKSMYDCLRTVATD